MDKSTKRALWIGGLAAGAAAAVGVIVYATGKPAAATPPAKPPTKIPPAGVINAALTPAPTPAPSAQNLAPGQSINVPAAPGLLLVNLPAGSTGVSVSSAGVVQTLVGGGAQIQIILTGASGPITVYWNDASGAQQQATINVG